MNPLVARILRTLLVGVGATLCVSAIVNIMGAVQLIDASVEAQLSLTRGEVIRSFVASFLFGALMIYAGLRRWTRKPKVPPLLTTGSPR